MSVSDSAEKEAGAFVIAAAKDAEGNALGLALWLADWPGSAEQGLEIWVALADDLLPKRTYLAKADSLIAQGWTRVTPARYVTTESTESYGPNGQFQ